MKHTVASRVAMGDQYREQAKENVRLTKENIIKIKNYSSTVEIKYPQFQEAFDYVDKLFPAVKVKEVVVLKVPTRFLAKIGYGGVGGFYDKIYKTVVISSAPGIRRNQRNKYSVCGTITKDEVIVHELIHYCDVEEGHITSSRNLAEEFAYGWSLQYLRDKGYSDEEIIENNFLPFLFQNEYDKVFQRILGEENITTQAYNKFGDARRLRFYKRHGKKMHKEAKEKGIAQGWKLLNLYSAKFEEGVDVREDEDEANRFDLMDLGD